MRAALVTSAVLGVAAVVAAIAPPTYADASPRPGDKPSTARVAAPAHTYRGDLRAQTPDRLGYRHALWKVRLHSVTQVTISWSHPTGGDMQLNVLPDVTNRSWPNQEPLLSRNIRPRSRDAFVFIAAVDGWYYLDFWVARRPGPYTFSLSRVTR